MELVRLWCRLLPNLCLFLLEMLQKEGGGGGVSGERSGHGMRESVVASIRCRVVLGGRDRRKCHKLMQQKDAYGEHMLAITISIRPHEGMVGWGSGAMWRAVS